MKVGGHYAPACRVLVIEAGSLPYTFHPGWRGKLKSIQPMMRGLEWDRGEGRRRRRRRRTRRRRRRRRAPA